MEICSFFMKYLCIKCKINTTRVIFGICSKCSAKSSPKAFKELWSKVYRVNIGKNISDIPWHEIQSYKVKKVKS